MPKITKKIPNITTHTLDFRNVVQKGCISIQIIWVGQLRSLVWIIATFSAFIPIFTIKTQLFAGSFKLFAFQIANYEVLFFIHEYQNLQLYYQSGANPPFGIPIHTKIDTILTTVFPILHLFEAVGSYRAQCCFMY